MRNPIRLTAALCTVVLLGTACGSGTSSGGSGTITIGALWDLTGPQAALGKAFQLGENAGIKYVNSNGGVLGKKLAVIDQDIQGTPTGSAAGARALIDQHVVALVGPDSAPGNILAIAPIADQHQIPYFTASYFLPGTDTDNATKYPYLYATLFTESQRVEYDVKYLTQLRGLTKVGIMEQSDGFGDSSAQATEAALEAAGFKAVAVGSFPNTAIDVTGQLTKVRDAGANGLVAWTFGPPLVATMRGFGTLGWNPPTVAPPVAIAQSAGIPTSALANVYAGPIPKSILINPSTGQASPQGQMFLKAFAPIVAPLLNQPGFVPDYLDSQTGFDDILTAAAAINAAGSTTGSAIKTKIETGVALTDSSIVFHYSPTNHVGSSIDEQGLVSVATPNPCGAQGCAAAPNST